MGSSGRRRGRGGKRCKHQESIEPGCGVLHGPMAPSLVGNVAGGPLPPSSSAFPLGPSTTSSSWPTSVGSPASLPPGTVAPGPMPVPTSAAVPYPPGVLPLYPLYPPAGLPQPLAEPSSLMAPAQTRFPAPVPGVQMPPQLVPPPVMALVLPNYMFPQINAQPGTAGPAVVPPGAPPGPMPFYNPNSAFVPPFGHASMVSATVQPPHTPMCIGGAQGPPRPPSRSSTPMSGSQREAGADREGAESMLLPSSRCSSPLNLLQLEEPSSNRLESASQQATPSAGQGGGTSSQGMTNQRGGDDDSKENETGEANESNQDAMSTSSEFLDMLLQEDSRSGTGSAASGSGSLGTGSSGSGSGSSGSGSNGCSSSGSGTRSSQSSHTSKYFGSIDSSENDHSRKQSAGGAGEAQFIKCVLQDPIWLLMANTDDKVMMTYQLPVRDRETVLRADRMALRSMQKHQPRFTEEQKRELGQVHPWMRTGRLPRAINISSCRECKSPAANPPAPPYDVEIHEMELGSILTSAEDGLPVDKVPEPDAAMEEGEEEGDGEGPAETQKGREEEQKQRRRGTSEEKEWVVERKGVEAQMDIMLSKDQEMVSEEQLEQVGKVTEMTL